MATIIVVLGLQGLDAYFRGTEKVAPDVRIVRRDDHWRGLGGCGELDLAPAVAEVPEAWALVLPRSSTAPGKGRFVDLEGSRTGQSPSPIKTTITIRQTLFSTSAKQLTERILIMVDADDLRGRPRR